MNTDWGAEPKTWGLRCVAARNLCVLTRHARNPTFMFCALTEFGSKPKFLCGGGELSFSHAGRCPALESSPVLGSRAGPPRHQASIHTGDGHSALGSSTLALLRPQDLMCPPAFPSPDAPCWCTARTSLPPASSSPSTTRPAPPCSEPSAGETALLIGQPS